MQQINECSCVTRHVQCLMSECGKKQVKIVTIKTRIKQA